MAHRSATRYATTRTALIAVTLCIAAPALARRPAPDAVASGAYLAGDIVGGRHDRTQKVVAAGIGAIAGGAIGAYTDRQERDLRAQGAGGSLMVQRRGDEILLVIPAAGMFAGNDATIQPSYHQFLDRLAQTLSVYGQTYIDLYGHTDAAGSERVNLPLSQNRATAVADYLASRGVVRARIATQGFGGGQPLTGNGNADGRQRNRRIEIRIVPVNDTGA